MSIAERHSGRSMPEKVADCGQRDSSHDEPGGKGMAEIMEVKIRQPCGLTGSLKAVPHIVPPMPGVIMEDPWDIKLGP